MFYYHTPRLDDHWYVLGRG